MEPRHLFFIRELHVSEPWLSLIASGQKTIEARVGSADKFVSIVNSRIITFTNMQIARSPHIHASIRAIRHYDTLDNFLRAEGWIHCAPQAHTYEEARDAFLVARNSHGVPVFSDENTREQGGITVFVLSKPWGFNSTHGQDSRQKVIHLHPSGTEKLIK